jgi:hypothetical protein
MRPAILNLSQGVFTAILLSVIPVTVADSGESIDETQGKRCISARSIRSTRVVSDTTVLFFMQGNKIFLNALPQRCNGLSREKRFSYTVSTGHLCAIDRISILRDSGFGIQEGRSCRLGRFHPITREELKELLEQRPAPPEERPVEPPPVEDVVTD